MRSSFALLLSTFGAMVLVANCTVKETSGDGTDTGNGCKEDAVKTGCSCPGNIEGSQTCGSDGKYGACDCPGTNTGGTSSNTGGDTSTKGGTKGYAGTSTTGGTGNGTGGDETVPADGGAGGAAGSGPVIDPTANCEDCLATLCPTQMDACLADPDCVADDGSGQYQDIIIGCIGDERANGVVTRDKVRGCGFTMGASSDPNTTDIWAPEPMAQSTADLMNCMAMGAAMPDASWANDPANFPNDVPKPWPAGTCAKLSCASAK